jgi:ABC-type transport system involved in multi-copper enzyme maturation permease subunit
MHLLHYRPWRGELRRPLWSVLPVARAAVEMVLRRKLFWGLYALSLLTFFLFFFGQYLLSWAETQLSDQPMTFGLVRYSPKQLIDVFSQGMHLTGKPEMFRNFFWYQGYMITVLLAMAGTVLVGNDFQYNSLVFYLSKPLAPRHYLLGKCLAVGVIVNMMTTLPALVLYFQSRILNGFGDLGEDAALLAGIFGYGLLLTVFFSLMLVATASWLRRTVPLIMVWTTLFLFFRLLCVGLVDGLGYNQAWRLLDLWNDTFLLGNLCLGLDPNNLPGMQPAWPWAAIVLGALSILCLIYLIRRTRAVEIVR